MNKIVLLLAATVSVGVAFGQEPAIPVAPATPTDHLVPEDSLLSGGFSAMFPHYHLLILNVLRDAFDRDVELRAVVLPSFSPEYAVGLRTISAPNDPSSYRVIYLRPEIQLWGYQSLAMMQSGDVKIISGGTQDSEIAKMKANLPKDPKDIKVAHCEKALDVPIAEAVKKAWMGVLYETRYDHRSWAGLDGVSYHFSGWDSFQFLAGTVWTPPRDTKPGMLAGLADALVAYCDGKVSAANLQNRAEAIQKKLTP